MLERLDSMTSQLQKQAAGLDPSCPHAGGRMLQNTRLLFPVLGIHMNGLVLLWNTLGDVAVLLAQCADLIMSLYSSIPPFPGNISVAVILTMAVYIPKNRKNTQCTVVCQVLIRAAPKK